MDFIEELRLRSWARRNHVPAADRSAAWEPVVLDEMNRKDSDVPSPSVRRMPLVARSEEPPAAVAAYRLEPVASPGSACHGYVPLMPDGQPIRIAHPGHDRLADPNLLQRIERLERIADPG